MSPCPATAAVPELRRARERLRAHSPLLTHALVEATDTLTAHTERSPIARSLTAALEATPRVCALDLAASGWPLGAVLVELSELAQMGALRVRPPLAAGDPAAATVLAQVDLASTGRTFGDSVSMKVAVAGPGAHAVVASLGEPHLMEGMVDRLPGHAARPWMFTRLGAGGYVVYVAADTAAAPGEEAWYQLLRGAVGVVVTVNADVQSRHLGRRAAVEARVAGLSCVLAGALTSDQVHPELDEVAPVAPAGPGDPAGSRAALRFLAEAIETGRQR